jgi:hypothetical protein
MNQIVTQEVINNTIDVKQIPKNVQTIFSAKYQGVNTSPLKVFTSNMSIPNCAFKCKNDAACTFATADGNNCTLWQAPIKEAKLLNDVASVTIVP